MTTVTVIINTYNIQKKKFLTVVICEAEITRAVVISPLDFLQLRKPDFAENEQTTLIYFLKLLIILSQHDYSFFEHAVHSYSRMRIQRALDLSSPSPLRR